MVKVSPGSIREFTVEILLKHGVSKQDSEYVADHLVLAELFGVNSHGIVRLPYYVDSIVKGDLNPKPEMRVIAENSTMVHIDGDNGLGQAIAAKVTEIAIKKAEKNNIGFGSAKNLGHVGMLSYYTFKAVKNDLFGVSIANAPSVMAPLGGKKAFLGTNPVSIGMPYRNGKHIIFDSAMSISSRGKILVAMEKGEKIPEGWAIDEEGNPTTDPEKAIKGALLPDGVKGYAISLIIDLFCGAMLGGKFGYELLANFSSQGGFAILVLNPKFFRDHDEYIESLEEYITKLKGVPTVDHAEIRLPGESKLGLYRRAEHIELNESVFLKLKELAKQVGVDFNLE